VFLLDTNVWVVYLRGKNSLLRQRLAAKSANDIAVCSVVLGELLYGALCSTNASKNQSAVEALVAPYVCLPFDGRAAEQFARIRHQLETVGTPIGAYDMQIAAIALATGCTVVTHNANEFGRVPGLLVEDWEAP
jgi:tRNA(fMet)-specific endonuclease VapC